MFIKFKSFIKNPFKGQKDAINAAAFSAGATVLLSPLSIWLGFSLNDMLSRPILSVQYASVAKVIYLPEPTNDLYALQALATNFGVQFDRTKAFSTTFNSKEMADASINEFNNFKNHLENQVQKFIKMQASSAPLDDAEILEALSIGSIEGQILRGYDSDEQVNQVQQKLQSKISQLNKSIEKLKVVIANLGEQQQCELYIQVLVLNRGSSVGLVKSSATFRNKDNEPVAFVETTEPVISTPNFRAVDVNVTNEEITFLKPQNSVGQVPPSSMKTFWYKPKNGNCDLIIKSVELESHIGNKMKRKVYD